jgi:uncharacterized protein
MMRRTVLAAVALAALALAPAAAAHVTVNPNEVEADSFSRFAIRVPTERPDASTVKVELQLPEGLDFVSFQPKPGWTRTVKMEKLAQPKKVFGETITERVASVTWSGGKIAPSEFDEFGMSAHVPNAVGKELVFPALQTYSSGEVVRWIGAPDAEEPAPRVKLAAAEATAAAPPPAPAAAADEEEDDGLATVALVVGIVALLAGLGALALGFRRPRRA